MLQNSCQVLDLEDALDASGNLVTASTNLRRNLRKAQRTTRQNDAMRVTRLVQLTNVDSGTTRENQSFRRETLPL